jgi:hypothetical protein
MGRPTTEESGRKAKATAASRSLGSATDWNVGRSGDDFIMDVNGRDLVADMWKMAQTDETVGAMLWCITSIMAQIEWAHVAQVDGVDNDTDPEAKKAKEFADTMLLDMEHSFDDHIEDALVMIWAGFAPCEIILKQRDGVNSRFDDMLWGIDSLPLRDPLTIWSWKYDDRQRIEGMYQMNHLGSAMIPRWKILLYRTSAQFNNPQGRPLLQNARRVWQLKKKIQDSEAIGIERDLCGLPTFRLPQAVIDQAAEVDSSNQPTLAAQKARSMIQNALKAVKDMRFNKSGGLVIPSDTYADDIQGDKTPMFDFKIITTAGQRSIDTRTAARDYDRAIARVAMMQFLHLGDRSTGSYSLSDDQSSMAVRSFMALAFKIAEEFTRNALGLVWTVNAMDKRYMPRLGNSSINKDGIQQIGAFLGGLGKSMDFWASDPVMRIDLAKQANLEYDPVAQHAAAATAKKTADMLSAAPPAPGAPPKEGSADD